MATTNTFTHPVFRDGAFTANDRDVAGYALRKVHAQPRPCRRARAPRPTSSGAAARARSPTSPRTSGPPSTATPEGARTSSPRTCVDQGYGLRFAIEPKPNEPRGDILLPTVGHALAFITSLEHADMVGLNPGGRARADGRARTSSHGIAQALWHGKLFHIDLNGQHGPEYDQDLVFGHGDLRERVLRWSTCSRHGGYDGPRHFDYKPPRTEDHDGVWASAAAQHAHLPAAQEAGGAPSGPIPRCRRRWTAAGCPSWPPRPWPRASLTDLLADRGCVRGPRRRASAGRRGMHYAALDQLAIEHLLGARS